MTPITKSRLLTTSAIVGLSVINLGSPASAQDAFGIHNDQAERLDIEVAEDEEVYGTDIGIYADAGPITVVNAGSIRGDGASLFGPNTRPSGGIVIAQGGSIVTNLGAITGINGIATSYFFSEDANGDNLPPQALAIDTQVINAGLIQADGGTGVALAVGNVFNSGTIIGLNGAPGSTALGTGVILAEFPEAIDPDATGVGSVINSEGGVIYGATRGVLISGGGTIENAGLISANQTPTPTFPAPIAIILSANPTQLGRTASIENSGEISGFIGVIAAGSLESVAINNTGAIFGTQLAINSTLVDGVLSITNGAGGLILSNGPTIGMNSGTLELNNAGEIRSNSQSAISISTANSLISNSGLIQGQVYGIVTNPAQVSPGVFETRSVNTTVENSGAIIGLTNDGIRLQGGGSVTNSGLISGRGNPQQADGVSIFSVDGQDLTDYVSTVTNTEEGVIDGARFGVIISTGGTIDNAGVISGALGGAVIQNGLEEDEITGSVTNTGEIFSSNGNGLSLTSLAEATVTNSGEITGLNGDGILVRNLRGSTTTIVNEEGGGIFGSQSGVHGDIGGVDLVNAGTIRGNGTDPGFTAPPDAGVTLSGGPSSVTNSGTISGAALGITTAFLFNPATGQLEELARDTIVTNSGTIIGDTDDGVRLIGGGSVVNSGVIEGRVGAFADGISMFPYTQQANEDYSASVVNEATGSIAGQRFGVILSAGGDVDNAGSIEGVTGGIFIQGTALNTDPDEERSGLTASVVNSGTITGTGDLGGSFGDGYGVGFGSDMSTATLENSGTITSVFGAGVNSRTLADVTVTNLAGGLIVGGTSGIYSAGRGTIAINNAGTIRGEGSYDGFAAPPDAGIDITTANSSVINSGTISGAGAGITTAYQFDEEIGDLVLLSQGTSVVNSGTIIGESNDGIRLIGGGSVENSGTISGSGAQFADGVSMFRGEGQAFEDYSAVLTNSAEGEITGQRFGIIFSEGGSIDNAGTVTGNGPGGVLIQQGLVPVDETPVAATLVNSGTITGLAGYGAVLTVNGEINLENSGTIEGQFFGALIEGRSNSGEQTATVTNSGTISGATEEGLLISGGFVSVTVDNSGTIAGEFDGLSNFAGDLVLTNTGSITSVEGTAVFSSGAINLDNSGIISGGSGIAVQLSDADDVVTLRTGSAISGLVDAADGYDTLTLEGSVLELTEAQQLTASFGFEELTVGSGFWNTAGAVGVFDTVLINQAATLRVNEIEGVDGAKSPIFTAQVENNGLLVLNFSQNDIVSDFDEVSITGTGQLQLIGEAVFTLDTDSVAHTGGTIISNGGLVLTGSLQGDVRTEGDGYFQLGAGGTEGAFSGNIVNNGRFVFNRVDDYDFLGAFSGTGILDKMGAGTLVFMGDYSFEGVTNIMAGRVRIGGVIDPETDFNLGPAGSLDISGTDQTIGGLAGSSGASVVIDESTLTVDQDEDTVFAGVISGAGSLVIDGSGTLNLTGNNTYTGPTTVNNGTLAVNGSITSPVTVNDGGTLGGNGTVGSTTVASGGTVAPGNSIGRLTVAGNLAFAAGSIYEVEANAAGAADRIDATGTITIASTARVAVLAEAGNYNPRTDYTILTGAGGVTGTFGSVTSNLAFLTPRLRYGATSVTLSLYRNDINFADVAANSNQAGVAAAVQALGIDNPLFEAVLVQSASTARASFGELSGEIFAGTLSGLTDDSRHLRNALMGMRAPEESGVFVWGSGFGGWGDFDAGANNYGMKTDHMGIVAGVGFGGNGFAAALSAGIGGSDFRMSGRADRADVESKYLAAHASFGAEGGLQGSVGVSYAWHEIETSRSIAIAPLVQTLISSRDGETLQLFGELAYEFVAGKTSVTPFARLAHVDTGSDAFVEAGGNAALTVAKADQNTTFLSLGARAQFNTGDAGFQPYLSAAWNRAFDDRSGVIASRFTAGGSPFGVIGVEIPRNSAEVEAGFEFTTGMFRLGAAYTGTLASDREVHGARITARVSF